MLQLHGYIYKNTRIGSFVCRDCRWRAFSGLSFNNNEIILGLIVVNNTETRINSISHLGAEGNKSAQEDFL